MNCLKCDYLRRVAPVGCYADDAYHIELTDNKKPCKYYKPCDEIKEPDKPTHESLRYKHICLFDNFALVRCIDTELYYLDVYSEDYITRYDITALIKKGDIE